MVSSLFSVCIKVILAKLKISVFFSFKLNLLFVMSKIFGTSLLGSKLSVIDWSAGGGPRMQNNCEGTRSRSEEALVRQAQAGDQDAFGELMRRHYTASLKTAISILRVREEAEDEVQNAYWKAYQYVGQFQGDAQFSTWLTRIVVNQCLMRLRQARRELRRRRTARPGRRGPAALTA